MYSYDVSICGSAQGTHQSLKNDQHAKSVVSGIIDGTGSFGAALGPLIVGVVSDKLVSNFFYVLLRYRIIYYLLRRARHY